MKAKNISLMVASVFVLMFSLAFASATLSFDQSDLSKSIEVGLGSVTVDFDLTADANYTGLVWSSTVAPNEGTIAYPSVTAIDNETLSLSVSLSGIPNDFAGNITTDVTVTDSNTNDTTTVPLTIEVTSPVQYPFCDVNSYSDGLDLKVDIENKGQGEDDAWMPLDNVEVTVEFKNDKDSDGEETYDLRHTTFELALYKADSTNNLADDLIWLSEGAEEFEQGKVNEGDKVEHTFAFRVDPSEFDEGDYRIMVKVYGEDDNEDEACVGSSDDLLADFGDSVYYADLTIGLEDDKDKMVIVDTKTLPQDATALCEQEVTFTADVWNVGNQDFLDQFKVSLKNDELGVDESQVYYGDLDSGDSRQLQFTFEVPKGVEEKDYTLEMKTYYDYDDKDDEYDKESDDAFTYTLSVEGGCKVPEASMSASLESGGKAGVPLNVKVTVTNTGTEESTYTFDLTGYSDWASEASIDTNLTPFTLESGESKEIMVSLAPNKDLKSGDYTFNVVAYSDKGEMVLSQPVQVAVESKVSSLIPEDGGLLAILAALVSAVALAVIIVLLARAFRQNK